MPTKNLGATELAQQIKAAATNAEGPNGEGENLFLKVVILSLQAQDMPEPT